ncbi:RNA polymerase III subunit C82 [Dispira simplex]|nr:RNA polymerase III subunit C82 [Dispira simplex]
MSAVELRLIHTVLREHFGPIVEQVGSTLGQRGRLPLRLLVQLTGLKIRQVQQALVVLIQHNLVTWAESPHRMHLLVFYEIDIRRVLLRLRIGDVLGLTQELFDREGLQLVQQILLVGKLKVGKLKEKLGWSTLTPASQRVYLRHLQTLIRHRYLEGVQYTDSITVDDKNIALDAKAKENLAVIPNAKEIARIRQMRMERNEAEFQENRLVGMKRKIAEDNDNDKDAMKIRIGGFEMVEELDQDVYFRVNFERYNVQLRTRRLVDFAHERVNKSGAVVLRSMMTLFDDRLRLCREELSPPASLLQVTHQLPQGHTLNKDIDLHATDFGMDIHSHSGDLDGNFVDNGSSQTIVQAFLQILQTDTEGIVFRDDFRSKGQYRVNFVRARAKLRDMVLFSYLQEKFGPFSCRIIRILHEKHKLDDKQLAKLALLPPKVVRQVVHEMLAKGFIQLQEVPRTSERTPATCYYLFYASPEIAHQVCLQLHYEEIDKLYSRRTHELELRKLLLEKTNREDVRKDPSLLTSSDKRALDALQKTLDLIDASLLRLDRQVLILRDF